jgi:hypothetical protein
VQLIATSSVADLALGLPSRCQLQPLLDAWYPRPLVDVFPWVVAPSHRRYRSWLATEGDGLLGLVMLSVHIEGDHLGNPALAPALEGGASANSWCRLCCNRFATRIRPWCASPLGSPCCFQPCGQLADGSTAMLILLSGPVVSEPLAP